MAQGRCKTYLTQIENWRWSWVFSLILLLGMMSYYGYLVDRFAKNPGNTDFLTFFLSSEMHHQNQPLYVVVHLRLPVATRYVQDSTGNMVRQDFTQMVEKINFSSPLFTWLMLPFIYAQYVTGFIIFACISVLLALAACWCVTLSFDRPRYMARFFLLSALILAFRPSIQNLELGQVGFLLFFLLALGFYLFKRHYFNWAAVVLGVAAVIKFFCLLFLLYFLLQRRWRMLLIFSITFIGALFLPLIQFDWQTYVRYFHLIHTGPGPERSLILYNGSLMSFFMRLKQVFAGSSLRLDVIGYVANLLLVIFYCYTTWKRKDDNEKFLYHFSLTIVCMLLLSPLGWSYYYPALIFAFIYIVATMSQSLLTNLIYLPIFIAMLVLEQFYFYSLAGCVAFIVLFVTLALTIIARYSTVTDLAKLRG